MIEPSFVGWIHKTPLFTDEDSGEVHRFVDTIRGPIGFEAIDSNLRGLMQIPARFSPEVPNVAGATSCLAIKERMSACGSIRIEINSRSWLWCGNCKLIKLKSAEL